MTGGTVHPILVVEDDDIIRDTLLDFLDDNGYQAIGAEHGKDALNKLAGAARTPCLIVLDLMMPVMDGQVFRERQLEDPALSRIPVVVISAYKDLAPLIQSMKVDTYLAKPLKLGDLLAVVQRHCPGD
jgi:CheY-like chemotaxis protein